jgi:hypothetical protein
MGKGLQCALWPRDYAPALSIIPQGRQMSKAAARSGDSRPKTTGRLMQLMSRRSPLGKITGAQDWHAQNVVVSFRRRAGVPKA